MKIDIAALTILATAGVAQALSAQAQPVPTRPPGGLDPSTIVGDTSIAAIASAAAAAVPRALVGAPSGVAPLDSAGQVPRGNLPVNTLNLATLGAKLDGSASDAATIQGIYAAAPAGSILDVPMDGRLPSGLSLAAHAGAPVEWNLLGTNYSGPTGSGLACGPLDDGGLTRCFSNGYLGFYRHIKTGQIGSPQVFMSGEVSSGSYTYNGYAQNGPPTLQINGQNDAGANDSFVAQQTNLNLFDKNGADENVAQNVNVTQNGTGDSWDFSGQTQETTIGAPVGFQAVFEGDYMANGYDAPSSAYTPGTGKRWLAYLAPKVNAVPNWAASTAYAVGAKVIGTDTAGTPDVFVATTAGTSGAAAPTWPTAGNVKDGGVTWTYGQTEHVSIGAGLWLDNGESNLTSYGVGIGTNAIYDDAVIDLSRATLSELDGSNTGAAIRIAANQPIDFSGNATLAGMNQHTLQYSTYNGQNALVYNTPTGSAFWLFDASQAAKFAGPVALDSAGNSAGVTTGYLARGLNIGWNVSNGGQETDLVGGQGGYAFYVPTSAGVIAAPQAKLSSTGELSTTSALINRPLATPASSSAPCSTGDQEADANYVYVCTATNTWKRAALAAF